MSDDIPIHTEFNRIPITRRQLLQYHQHLRTDSMMLGSLISQLYYIKNLIDNHSEQTKQVLLDMLPHIVHIETSMLPYRDHEIDVWKSLDTFIKECNDFTSNQVRKIHGDLRSEDYYGQLPYNFKYLSSIQST